jgi:hypothetical protein
MMEFLYLKGILTHQPMFNRFFPSLSANFSQIPYQPLERNFNIPFQWAQNQSIPFQRTQALSQTIINSIPEAQN